MKTPLKVAKVIVASQNPAKLQAVADGFKRMFPDETFTVSGVSVASGVSDQPANDSETYQGALNRATNAKKAEPDADYWVGLEGGVEDKGENMESYNWVVILGSNGQIGRGKTGIFFLPPQVAALIRQGKELGEADDIVFKRTNSKQANGAIGLLTHDVITRSSYNSEAIVLALIPFRNPQLYPVE